MLKSIRYVSVAVVCGLLAPQANAPRVAQTPELSLSAKSRATLAQSLDAPATRAAGEIGHSTAFQLRASIERALVALDEREREAAFTTLLPQLIEQDSATVEQLIEECDTGPVCDRLVQHAVAAAARSDVERAIQWVANMPDDEKRHSAARDLVQHVARQDPGAAIKVADRFDVGRDDGSLEHLMQIWAVENPTAAQRWLDAQPPGPQRDQLYARLNFARSNTTP